MHIYIYIHKHTHGLTHTLLMITFEKRRNYKTIKCQHSKVPFESLTFSCTWILYQSRKPGLPFTSPVTGRELTTHRNNLSYSWATLSVASPWLWWAATYLTITSTNSLVLALISRATKSKCKSSHVTALQIFKEAKGTHHAFLRLMPKH